MNKYGQGKGKGKRRLKAANAAAMAASGMTTTQIAKELGMSRNGVSELLNSKEAEAIIKQAESRVVGMIEKACGVVEKAMEEGRTDSDMNNGLKAALAVLKSVGVIKEKVDLSHSFPKPTVIKRFSGGEVILGTHEDLKNEED